MIELKDIYPHLTFLKDLVPHRKSPGKAIYQVGVTNSRYVLKIVSTDTAYLLDRNELLHERDVLIRAKGISNITNLVDFYDHKPAYVGLLKEYAEGDALEDLTRSYQKKRILTSLQDTIAQFHERGMACLDIHQEDIIISPNGKQGTFIDLNTVHFNEYLDTDFYNWLKENDYTKLEEAFKQQHK